MTHIRNTKLLAQFGKHLRSLREERGLTQDDLASQAGIPLNQVGRMERGEVNPSLSTLHVIAGALKMSVSKLMEGVK